MSGFDKLKNYLGLKLSLNSNDSNGGGSPSDIPKQTITFNSTYEAVKAAYTVYSFLRASSQGIIIEGVEDEPATLKQEFMKLRGCGCNVPANLERDELRNITSVLYNFIAFISHIIDQNDGGIFTTTNKKFDEQEREAIGRILEAFSIQLGTLIASSVEIEYLSKSKKIASDPSRNILSLNEMLSSLGEFRQEIASIKSEDETTIIYKKYEIYIRYLSLERSPLIYTDHSSIREGGENAQLIEFNTMRERHFMPFLNSLRDHFKIGSRRSSTIDLDSLDTFISQLKTLKRQHPDFGE